MADGSTTVDRLRLLLRDVLGADVPTDGMDLIAAGLLDSLALAAILAEIEEQFVRVPRRGRLVARLVQDDSGRPLGWYVYYVRPGWRSEVLQVVADRGNVGRVVDHLFAHAHRHGSAALRGRLEPGLVGALSQRRCLLWHRGGAMVHSRDADLLCAVQSDRTLVTRLEGEWWGDTFR